MLARRDLLVLTAGGLAAEMLGVTRRGVTERAQPIEAIAFDAFVLFDPGPLSSLADRLYPGRGVELAMAWRTRQFEYCWLRCLTRRHADFEQITEDALVFSAERLHLDLSRANRQALLQAVVALPTHDDVVPGLRALADRGVRLALLSNMTVRMLRALLVHNAADRFFDHVLSTDALATYKPDPRAYQLAIDAFRLPKAAIAFAAFAGWDAAGAAAFGYRTYWANRLRLPVEQLGDVPDASGPGMHDLVRFVDASVAGAERRR